jgi:hypothetical protein
LPEKRFGGKGHSAVVGTTKRARLVMKKRKERRRGGRKRLRKMMRMDGFHSSCFLHRAELTMSHYVRSTRLGHKYSSITHS